MKSFSFVEGPARTSEEEAASRDAGEGSSEYEVGGPLIRFAFSKR